MAESAMHEREEAVIISGPRKGEFITLNRADAGTESELRPEEEAMLDFAVEAYRRMAESAVMTVEAAQRVNQTLDDVHRRIHEPVGQTGRNSQVRSHDRLAIEAVA